MSRVSAAKRPGITEVAALARVSIGTVSNVLNNPQKVSSATRARVTEAIELLGFVRNDIARNLVRGSAHAIGLSVIDVSNSLFVDIARGAHDAAIDAGMNLLIASAADRFEQQERNLDYFDGARVDGILLAPMQDSHASIDRLRRHGRPVVLMNYGSRRFDACSVLIDNEMVGYLAARHLIDLGRRRIVFVGGDDALQPVKLRRAGVRRAVAEEGDRVALEEFHSDDLTAVGGRRVGLALAQRGDALMPDAIIAVTDLLASGIIEAFIESGISVPQDVAVMGCDSNSAAWGGSVPLTTVSMHGFEMGYESVRLLLEELAEPDTHQHREVMLSPDLVVRESTLGRMATG